MKKIFTSLGCALLMSMGMYAADTVPWSNDFSNYANSISGWKQTKYNNSSKGFTVSSGELYIQQGVNNANIHDESWIVFTGNGFELEKGKGYKFEMVARTNNTENLNARNNFKVMLVKHVTQTLPGNLGQAQTTYVGADGDVIKSYIGTPVNTLISEKNIIGTERKSLMGYFEVEDDGIYDLCIYVCKDYASRALYFDDFKLSYGSMDAPAASAIEIVPDASGILKAQVKVTTPDKTIRGEKLSAITKLEIYRDGGIAKAMDNVTPNQTITFTDFVAQPGNHIYSVVAYNDNGPGLAYETQVSIGGIPETQTWGANNMPYWAKYTADGKIRIEWPAAADAKSYKVETLSGRVISGTPTSFTKYDNKDEKDIDNLYLIDDKFEAGNEPIGWQYKVTKIAEDGTETKLGTTNYICLNNQVPYFPNMQTTTAMQAFTTDNDYQFAYQYNSSGGGQIMSGISRPYGVADKTYFYENWLISPGLMLSKDKFYRVKVTSCSDDGTVTYKIKAGKGSHRQALDIMVTEEHPTVKGSSNMDVLQTDEMFLSVPEDGQYFVGITPSIPNSVNSSSFRMRRFDIIEVDPTLPNVPNDVMVAYSPNGGTKGSISFTVPTKAINGEDVKGLTKIEILKDGEAFQTITDGVVPGAKLSFDVTVTAGQKNVYAIRAYNAAGQGETASATVFVLSTPYSNDFSTKNSLEGFTLINNLNTAQNFHLQYNAVRLFYDDRGNDHWLIMPPISLTAGQYYQFNYNIKATDDEAGDCIIKIGKAPNPEMLTDTITNTFQINAEKNIFGGNHEDWFTVEESGQYFIGFHLTKPAGRHTKEIYIDNLSIANGVQGTVPDQGTLKVIPAADGSLKATLSYTAPTKGLNGTALNTNSTLDVMFYINGEQTGGIQPDGTPNPATRSFKAYPGQNVSIDIAVSEDLPYIFSAKANWNGRPSYVDAFVGINTPSYPDPSSIIMKETLPYGHVTMSWDPVTKDIEGYDMNPDNLKYEVMTLTQSPTNPDNLIEIPVLTNISGTSCEFDAISADDPQTMKRYILRARNSKGKGSQGVFTQYINVGKPYRMPYQESFAGDDSQPGAKTAIFSENLEGYSHWGLMKDGLDKGVTSGDGDGCYLAMEALYLESKGRFYTGKINLGSGEKPALTVMVYNPSADGKDAPNTIQPMVYTYADSKWHAIDEPRTVSELTKNRPGWNKVTYDLSKYADNVVTLAFDAVCMKHTFTSLDNIRVWETPETDLSFISHDAPVSAAPGIPFDINVNVANNGAKACAPESIEMYVDNQLATSLKGEEIEAGKSATIKFTHSFPAVDLAESHDIRFEIKHADDCDTSDNTLTASIATVNTHLPVVTNLTGVADDNQLVTLSWDKPVIENKDKVTESFEDWTVGNASQFGWTSYDGDRRPILGVNNGSGSPLVIPGLPSNEKASFAVIDAKNGPFAESQFPAFDGNKFLMSISPNGGTGSTDDWFISPLLSGKAQTITFCARNYQGYRAGIEVLASKGGMSIDSFESVTVGAIDSKDWQGLLCELPEGTRRFAIRNISYCEESFMLMLDNITYEPATGDAVALQGYNIYNDDDCVATSDENKYKFTLPHETGEYTYGVSARYANGESKVVPVNVVVMPSGVTEISLAEGVHIFGGKGCIHITGAENQNVTIYDVDGRMVANGVIAESGRVAAAAGVYVVVAGDKKQQVLVK